MVHGSSNSLENFLLLAESGGVCLDGDRTLSKQQLKPGHAALKRLGFDCQVQELKDLKEFPHVSTQSSDQS